MESTADDGSRKYINLFLIIFALCVIPFLILNYFNHPTTEDFYFTGETHKSGYWDTYRGLYKFWGGRYFGYLLVCINPLYFYSFTGYKIATLVILFLLLITLYFTLSEFTKKDLSVAERVYVCLSVFFLYLFAMPSVGQGFYWLVSSIYYNLGLIFLMLFFVFYFRMNNGLKNGKLNLFLCCLLIPAASGSNLLAAVDIFLFVIFLTGYYFIKKREISFKLILINLVTVVSLYYCIKAPGNIQRAGQYSNNEQFLFSFSSTFVFLAQEFNKWILFSPLLLITLLILPVLTKLYRDTDSEKNIFNVNPLVSFFLFSLLLFVNIFVIYWSLGEAPYGRILNFIYFIFLAGWFFNISVISVYIRKKYGRSIKKLPQYVYAASLIVLLIFIFQENNIRTAYKELLDGTAKNYNNNMFERYNFISENKSDSVGVERMQNVPESFFLIDVYPNPEVFYNKAYATYFNKKAIFQK